MIISRQLRQKYSLLRAKSKDELCATVMGRDAAIERLRADAAEADAFCRQACDERDAALADRAAALEALSDMVFQFFTEREDGTLSHSFMSAEEHAIGVLLDAGRAEQVARCRFKLIGSARKGEGE